MAARRSIGYCAYSTDTECPSYRAVVQPQSRALPFSSSSHLLKQLHWLPLDWRIRFILSILTFKALHTGRPKYVTDLLHLHKHTRSMRSPYTQLLTLPRHNLSFGSRAFRISAPKNWNTLPLEVRQSHSLSTFRNRLKTFCFRSAYQSSSLYSCHQCALILLETSALYKSFTYLLYFT